MSTSPSSSDTCATVWLHHVDLNQLQQNNIKHTENNEENEILIPPPITQKYKQRKR